jgi:integrase
MAAPGLKSPGRRPKIMSEIPSITQSQGTDAEKYIRLRRISCDMTLVFPVPSNQKMNAYLKEIATICNISKVLTTHVARHTFATTIAMSNNIPLRSLPKSSAIALRMKPGFMQWLTYS